MIKESYLSEVYSMETDSEQQTFDRYTDTTLGTTIAVITEPTGGITDVCDEYIPELGMPKSLLDEFRERRSSLEIEDDTKRHNKAADLVQLESKYREYLQTNDTAREKLEMLRERHKSGEKITVVCFEGRDKWCHRHVLQEVLTDE